MNQFEIINRKLESLLPRASFSSFCIRLIAFSRRSGSRLLAWEEKWLTWITTDSGWAPEGRIWLCKEIKLCHFFVFELSFHFLSFYFFLLLYFCFDQTKWHVGGLAFIKSIFWGDWQMILLLFSRWYCVTLVNSVLDDSLDFIQFWS